MRWSAGLPSELKWSLMASVALHGAALVWVQAQPMQVPAPSPPIEVRISRAEDKAEPARGARRSTLHPMPGRDGSAELAAPAAVAVSHPAMAQVETHLRPLPTAATSLSIGSAASAPLPSAATDAASAPLGGAQPMSAASGPRTARSAEALTAAGGAVAASAALASEPIFEASHMELRTAGGGQPRPAAHPTADMPSLQWRTAEASAATAGEAQRASAAHERDKTPWASASPAAAPTPPLDLRPPPLVAWGDASAGARPQTADQPASERGARGLNATAEALSLQAAESAPSTALALARLAPAARACFAPPPPEWDAQGRVVLRIRVDEEGRPADVAVDSGSGDPRLDRLAREQADRCARFDLYDRQGRRRPGLVRLPVVYRIVD